MSFRGFQTIRRRWETALLLLALTLYPALADSDSGAELQTLGAIQEIGSALSATGDSLHCYTVGVLANHGMERCREEWTPLVDYLSDVVPGACFLLRPLAFEGVETVVRDAEVDFLIVNPAMFAELVFAYGVSPVGTKIERIGEYPTPLFAGLIYTLADREDINTLQDLVGKRFGAVKHNSFGGWLMAAREFAKSGMNPARDFESLVFAETHEEVINMILAGEIDAGTVRTNTDLTMVRNGRLDIAKLKLLNRQPLTPDFPLDRSTRTYPNWPIATLAHVPTEVAQGVADAISGMDPNAPAAVAADIAGWSFPLSYQPVLACLKELEYGPYTPERDGLLLLWILENRSLALFIAVLVLALLVLLAFALWLSQHYRVLANRLAESAGNTETIARQSRTITWEVDVSGRFTAMGGAVEEVLGVPGTKMVGEFQFHDLFHADGGRSPETTTHDLLASGKPFRGIELPAKKGTDEVIWLANSGYPIFDRAEVLLGYRGNSIDITERKQSEQAKKDQLALLQAVADLSVRLLMLTGDQQDEMIVSSLQRLATLFGVDRAYVFSFSDDLSRLSNTHEWCVDGIPPQMARVQDVPSDSFPWITETMAKNRYSHVPALDTLPPEASAERREFEKQGIQSLLCLSLINQEGDLTGFMGFDAVHQPRVWSEQEIEMLQIAADMLASAMGRNRAELLLRRSEELHRKMISNMGDVIVIIDEDGTNRYKSDNIEKFFGWKPHEIVGANALENVHPEDLNGAQSLILGLLETPNATGAIECRYRCKDGTYKWISFTGCNLLHDPDICGILGNYCDITARKQAEKERDAMIAVVANSDNIIVVKDLDLRVVATNRAFAEVAGFESVDLLIGKTDAEIFGVSPDTEPIRTYMEDERCAQTCAPGQYILKEEPVICTDGQIKTVLTKKYPIFDSSGKVIGTGNISIDITERKRIEAELEKAKELAESASREKSKFLANMSHEIRTPLNGVIGFTELLKTTQLSALQQQYVNNANVSGQTLLGIIEDILDFSKIEAGMLELEILRTDIVELLEHSVDMVRFAAAEKELEILLDIDPKLPRFAHVDPVRLKQILANLLGNAVKFTHKGEVELKVTFQELKAGQGKISFSVRDSGIGISVLEREKLFKAFSQADSSTTRKFGGTGLGLIISQMIACKMGSSIQVSSSPGVGSSFFFDICATVDEEPEVDRVRIAPVRRCLLIDDNVRSRAILQRMLQQWQIGCDAFGNVDDALCQIGTLQPYDVVVCDNQMHGTHGLRAFRMIREQTQSRVEALPFILLYSALEDSHWHKQCDEMGIHFRLSKPVKREEFFAILCDLHGSQRKRLRETERFSAPDDKTSATGTARILIAEDVPLNMALTRAILSKLMGDVAIFEAANGIQAVEQYQQMEPELILMDVHMPECDGLEATAAIRKIEATTGKRVPIVALTAGITKDEREKCMEVGMDEFLTKPVDREKIRLVLDRLLLKGNGANGHLQEALEKLQQS